MGLTKAKRRTGELLAKVKRRTNELLAEAKRRYLKLGSQIQAARTTFQIGEIRINKLQLILFVNLEMSGTNDI